MTVDDTNPGLNRPQPRPVLDSFVVYEQGKSDLGDCNEPIKLSSNESSFGPSPRAVAAYRSVADRLCRYPDGSQHELKLAIADTLGLDYDKIVCGNGSEELIGLTIRAYLDPDDELLLTENNFVMCPIYGKMQGAKIVLAKEKDFTIDVDAVLEEVSEKTRVVIIANPNNPTGTYIPGSELLRLHGSLPENILFVIDDAYAEYVTAADYDTGMHLVEEFENVMVTRTFSKIHALPALRIGWCYCPAHVARILNKVRTPFNSNSAAMAAAAASIRDTSWIDEVKKKNSVELERTTRALANTGIMVVPSMANFYLLCFDDIDGKTAEDATSWLERDGIIPRPVVGNNGRDVLRITVGMEHENTALINSLQKYMSTP